MLLDCLQVIRKIKFVWAIRTFQSLLKFTNTLRNDTKQDPFNAS